MVQIAQLSNEEIKKRLGITSNKKEDKTETEQIVLEGEVVEPEKGINWGNFVNELNNVFTSVESGVADSIPFIDPVVKRVIDYKNQAPGFLSSLGTLLGIKGIDEPPANVDEARQRREQAAQDYPGASMAGTAFGVVPQLMATGGTGIIPQIMMRGSIPARLAKGTTYGAGIGASEGAISEGLDLGLGNVSPTDNTGWVDNLTEAVKEGLIFGGATGGIGTGIGQAVNKLTGRGLSDDIIKASDEAINTTPQLKNAQTKLNIIQDEIDNVPPTFLGEKNPLRTAYDKMIETATDAEIPKFQNTLDEQIKKVEESPLYKGLETNFTKGENITPDKVLNLKKSVEKESQKLGSQLDKSETEIKDLITSIDNAKTGFIGNIPEATKEWKDEWVNVFTEPKKALAKGAMGTAIKKGAEKITEKLFSSGKGIPGGGATIFGGMEALDIANKALKKARSNKELRDAGFDKLDEQLDSIKGVVKRKTLLDEVLPAFDEALPMTQGLHEMRNRANVLSGSFGDIGKNITGLTGDKQGRLSRMGLGALSRGVRSLPFSPKTKRRAALNEAIFNNPGALQKAILEEKGSFDMVPILVAAGLLPATAEAN